MGTNTDGGHYGGSGTSGGEYLRLPPPEKSHTVYCDQAHYGPVYGGGAETRATCVQVVVVKGQGVYGGDVDGQSRGGTDRWGGGDGRGGDGDILSL